MCFVLGLLIFIPDAVIHHPNLRGEGLAIILLLSLSNIAAATYLLISRDIQWLSRPSKT